MLNLFCIFTLKQGLQVAMEPEEQERGVNAKTVLEFIQACGERDIDKIVSFFDEATVYHNVHSQPVVGAEAIRKVIQPFYDLASEIQWVVKQIAETQAGVVLTERVDRFLIKDQWVELPVMGSFEVKQSKISVWRDYFDMAQLREQLAALNYSELP